MSHFQGKQTAIRQRGFSLIEALFSALVLGIALLALAGFHATALQDGSQTKARSVAVNLAQQKLDDLRSFTRLEGDATQCGAGTFCFSEIAADAGGQEDGNALVLPAGTVTGNYTDSYSLAWTVSCATEAAGTTPSFGATCTDAAAKLVTATTSWTDNKGASQSVSLQSVIYGLDPSRMALAASPAFSNQLPKKPGYTPVGVPDAVPVPINTGGTQFKESSKPLPTVTNTGNGTEVSFDSVTYSQDGNNFVKDAQEEFSTVTCQCQFDGTTEAYTPTRKVWSGSNLVYKLGEKVSKVAGEPLGNSPPAHCDICCRDHHDRNMSSDPKYDPQRPEGDYTSGDHKHYWYSSCVNGTVGSSNCTATAINTSLASGTPFTAVTSGAYLESCRVGRVNGYWRVFQDWKLRKVTILPYNYLLAADNQVNTSNLNAYVGVVEKVVENAVKGDSGNGTVDVPVLAGRDLTLAANAAPVQLLSRAVYVDTIYGKDSPNTVDTDYYDALMAKISASQTAGNSAWLDYAPFYEANLTLLFDWSSSNTGIATVTSQPIAAIADPTSQYYGSYSRGKVAIVSGDSSGTSTITAKARLANSGVTGGVSRRGNSYVPGESFGTDYYDNLAANTLVDTVTVTRPASSWRTISGRVISFSDQVNLSEATSTLTVTLSSTSGTVVRQCEADLGDVATGWYYSCTVESGWSGYVTFSSASGYQFDYATTTGMQTGTSTTPLVNNELTKISVTWDHQMPDVEAFAAPAQ